MYSKRNELRIQLAAQRESNITACLLQASLESIKVATQNPLLAESIHGLMQKWGSDNTWETHLKAVDSLLATIDEEVREAHTREALALYEMEENLRKQKGIDLTEELKKNLGLGD